LVWILTLAGFIIGSGFFHYIFPGNQIDRLEMIFWIFTCLAFFITLGSVIGIEVPKTGTTLPEAMSLDKKGRILMDFSRCSQAVLFFSFLAATVFFPAMQSFILTPYGGEVLRLPVGETARFGMYTSYGTLLGMGVAYWGIRKTSGSGDAVCLTASLIIGAAAFGLLSLSAWQAQQFIGEAGLWLFGFSKGLYNAGISFLTMRLAHPVFSGIFMGLWNLISGLALAIGEMAGGFFLELGMRFWGEAGAAYAGVFLGIALGLSACLVLLKFIDVGKYWHQISLRLGPTHFFEPKVRNYLTMQR
jgi:BCD family chlorophyll transporter-like MFS transporter